MSKDLKIKKWCRAANSRVVASKSYIPGTYRKTMVYSAILARTVTGGVLHRTMQIMHGTAT
jgi:hypothetical protein